MGMRFLWLIRAGHMPGIINALFFKKEVRGCITSLSKENTNSKRVVLGSSPGLLLLKMSGGRVFISGTVQSLGMGPNYDESLYGWPSSQFTPGSKPCLDPKIKTRPFSVANLVKMSSTPLALGRGPLAGLL